MIAGIQNSACAHQLTPSSKSCGVNNSTLQTRGQREQAAPPNKMITSSNNLHKPESEAAWAGAPSAGILSADCFCFWLLPHIPGQHKLIAPRGHGGQGSLRSTGHSGSPWGTQETAGEWVFSSPKSGRNPGGCGSGVQPCWPHLLGHAPTSLQLSMGESHCHCQRGKHLRKNSCKLQCNQLSNTSFLSFWVPLTLPEAFPEQSAIDFCKSD